MKSKNRCRSCGDVATIDDNTLQPTGWCVACATPAVQAVRAHKRAERREDREVRVISRNFARCDICNGRVAVFGRRHDSCADLVDQGADTVAMFD